MRQQICIHSYRRVKIGDKIIAAASSTDTAFTVNGDVFKGTALVKRWSHAQLTNRRANYTFDENGTYTVIVDIAYLGAAAVDLTVEIQRPDGSTHSTPKQCAFTGSKNGELDDALVNVSVR